MLNGNHNYDDISPEHKETIQKKLQACLIDGPASFKGRILSYIDDFGYLLSPAKLYACIDIIEKLEELSKPTDEEQRAINLVWEMEQHQKCPDCGENHESASNIAATIIELMVRRKAEEIERPDYNAENN